MTACDVAVVGAGPAGLQAALAAGEYGLDVTLIDGSPRAGGQYFARPPSGGGEGQALFEALQRSDVREQFNCQVWDINKDLTLALYDGQKITSLGARTVILATGAYDRPAAFPGWTLPGVISIGAGQNLIKTQGVLPGKKVLIAGSGPLLLALAALLVQAGAKVAAVLEGSKELTRFTPRRWARLWGQLGRLGEGWDYWKTVRQAGVPYQRGWGVIEAMAQERVQGARIGRLDGRWGLIPGSEREIECDALCIGYGFLPRTGLGLLAGAKHEYRERLGGWVPWRDNDLQSSVRGLFAAGDGAGIGGAALAQIEGQIAGLAAARQVLGIENSYSGKNGGRSRLGLRLKRERRFQKLLGELFTPGPGINELARDDTVICRCEGVRLAAVKEAVEMGAHTVNGVKGLTRAGMGLCQGRMCGRILAGQIARLSGQDTAAAGTFTPRTPLQPLPVQAAGDEGSKM